MIPRLYLDSSLDRSKPIELTEKQAHYLHHVLRLSTGSNLLLFNGKDGLWDATIEKVTKKSVLVVCKEQVQKQTTLEDATLICSIFKPSRFDILIEKATELGITQIIPVLSDHSSIRNLNINRLQLHAIEASEQSKRLSIPTIHPLQPLHEVIHAYQDAVIWADESGEQSSPIVQVAEKNIRTILIGPEGGFSEKERDYLRSHKNIQPVHLGPLILRAETAGIAMLSVIQAMSNQWK